jgi:ribosomal protein S18 acetylase RimI-like enzyme
MVRRTGFFGEDEARIAVELVDEALAKGEHGSGYFFLFAEDGDGVAGYACFGPIPGTEASFDLYWIVVDPDRQKAGIGRFLGLAAERRVAEAGGRRLYADTSSRPQYEPTRGFYRALGYRQAALLEDFYAPGDGKVVFEKVITPGVAPS